MFKEFISKGYKTYFCAGTEVSNKGLLNVTVLGENLFPAILPFFQCFGNSSIYVIKMGCGDKNTST